MSGRRKTVLQFLDALVWWSRASDQLIDDMLDKSNERRNRSMCFLPLLPILVTALLMYFAITKNIPHFVYGLGGSILVIATAIAVNGPLGRPSLEDNEGKAKLRRSAFFFCLVILAFGNIIGCPTLLVYSALQRWTPEHSTDIAFALIISNITWFICLPTLYASWMMSFGFKDDF